MNTNTSILSDEYPSFDVTLPDGREFDISTAAGTASYLQNVDFTTIRPIDTTVKELIKIQKNERENPNYLNLVMTLNQFLAFLVNNADRDVFLEKVPQVEIQSWLNYMIQELKRLSETPIWTQTGALNECDTIALTICIPLFSHLAPVELAFDNDFFEVLANFAKVQREGNHALPNPEVCECLSIIVGNAFFVALSKWTPEKAFKKLEASGVLFEYLRYATTPSSQGRRAAQAIRSIDALLANLRDCHVFLFKKFQRGQPCGDLVSAILQGQDGSPQRRPEITSVFQEIVFIANQGDVTEPRHICSTCGLAGETYAVEQKLLACSRCHSAYYCSKRCQRADWKNHKPFCKTCSKTKIDSMEKRAESFAIENYVSIVMRMVVECDKAGLEVEDMVIEVDFALNQDGVDRPLLEPTSLFKIKPRLSYDNDFSKELLPKPPLKAACFLLLFNTKIIGSLALIM
mmetsp:Transcript_19321/g.47782  ORF Transcript_19321/g.47782 Transcript_19321/m.47782 type:complete len:460 (-) Transcript_19321:385-1764(-)